MPDVLRQSVLGEAQETVLAGSSSGFYAHSSLSSTELNEHLVGVLFVELIPMLYRVDQDDFRSFEFCNSVIPRVSDLWTRQTYPRETAQSLAPARRASEGSHVVCHVTPFPTADWTNGSQSTSWFMRCET